MVIKPHIFRDYDVRAVIPDDLDMEGVKRIGEATISHFKPKKVAIGRDARVSGEKILKQLSQLFLNAGIKITYLGQITTDMMTFSAGNYDFDLAIMVTASHNPAKYNGFKMATRGGLSVSGPTGFYQIRDLALSKKKLLLSKKKGVLTKKNIYNDWIDFCFSFVDLKKIKPFKVVVDTGNGVAGKLFSHPKIKEKLPIKIIPLYFELDGSFPNHLPDPLKMENLADLIKKVKEEKADFGASLDGDGDRIAFVDEKGKFVSGTLITSLLAESLLKKTPGATILYNAVCGRIAPETIEKFGGKSKRVRVGYSLIKQEMVKTKAIFAGEHSCHYFYKDTFNSEASLLTLSLVLELVSEKNKSFSQVISSYDKYVNSGENNFEVEDKMAVMKAIEKAYKDKAESIDWLDGVTIWFKDNWVNIRPSNTQPLLRLNIEADNEKILKEKENEFIKLIKSLGGKKAKE